MHLINKIKDTTRTYKSCLYYANWCIYDDIEAPFKIPFNDITHLCYAFLIVDRHTGEVKLSDPYSDLEIPFGDYKGQFQYLYKMKQKHRHVKTLMSIGGWSDRLNFKLGINSETKIERFTDSAVQILIKYGFDGIDLDYEYPEDRFEFMNLLRIVQILKYKLSQINENFIITAAIPATEENLQNFDLITLFKYVNFFNLMTYDFSGSWSNRVALHSNLLDYKDCDWSVAKTVLALHKINKDIKSKCLLGIPLYGKLFTNTANLGAKFSKVTDINYNKIFDKYIKNDPLVKINCDYGACYIIDKKDKCVIVFDDKSSVERKLNYVKSLGLAGIMFWESSGDSQEKSLISQDKLPLNKQDLNVLDYPSLCF